MSQEVMTDAIKNLRIKWVIRQHVGTVQKRWMVDLLETEYERTARADFVRLERDNPNDVFELVALLASEVAIDWTHRIKP